MIAYVDASVLLRVALRQPDAFGARSEAQRAVCQVPEHVSSLHIGRITSDGAALITFANAPGEVPMHPPATAGERLVEYLLR